jgi:hypothetical protein
MLSHPCRLLPLALLLHLQFMDELVKRKLARQQQRKNYDIHFH